MDNGSHWIELCWEVGEKMVGARIGCSKEMISSFCVPSLAFQKKQMLMLASALRIIEEKLLCELDVVEN